MLSISVKYGAIFSTKLSKIHNVFDFGGLINMKDEKAKKEKNNNERGIVELKD